MSSCGRRVGGLGSMTCVLEQGHTGPCSTRPSTKAESRDEILERHRQRRREAIHAAQTIALEIAAQRGTVTSTEVLAMMKERCPEVLAASPDKRWLGAVLLPSCGWVHTGIWARTGSNARPVPIWKRGGGA